jgi:hypothetical protein
MFPVCIPALCLNMGFASARIRKEWGSVLFGVNR